jgi:uncharacterized protein
MGTSAKNQISMSDFARAIKAFNKRIKRSYNVHNAILFGSYARGTQNSHSDIDIAIILKGDHGDRIAIALDMADIAFDIMLKTGILIEALPLWQDEMEYPTRFSNPLLIQNIKREGLRL